MPGVTFETVPLNRYEGDEQAKFEVFRSKNRFKQVKFSIIVVAIQLGLVCAFLLLTRYAVRADASVPENSAPVELGGGAGRVDYGTIQKNSTLQVMLVVAFACTCCSTFSFRSFSIGGMVLTFICISLALQWSLVARGLLFIGFTTATDEIRLDVHDITEALYAAYSMIVATSFILGKIAPINVLLCVMIYIPVYSGLKFLSEEMLMISDPGNIGPTFILASFFGFALQLIATKRPISHYALSSELAEASGLSFFGAVLFSVCLPVMNSTGAESDADTTRSVINTVVATSGCTIATAVILIVSTHIGRPRISMINQHAIQGGLAAGGIAVGVVATHMLQPFGALLLGLVVGSISNLSFLWLELGLLRHRLRLELTTGGRLSYFGIAACVGYVASVMMAVLSEEENGLIVYSKSLYALFPARIPQSACNSEGCESNLADIISNYPFLEEKARGRSAAAQAVFQAAALAMYVLVGALSGCVTGLLVRLSAAKCGNKFPRSVWYDESFILNQAK